jgi:hypothetical protein
MTKKGIITYQLETVPNKEPWPIVKIVKDPSLPFGKINNKPELNTFYYGDRTLPKQTNKDTSRLWNLIDDMCGDHTEWCKDWIADIFQHPNRKPGTALIFRGAQGTGKGTIFDVLMSKLLGHAHLTTSRNLFGDRFNWEASGKLLINLNEGSWDQSRKDIGALKNFITDPEFYFE